MALTRALATQIHEYRAKIRVARFSKDKTAEAIKWDARIKEADRYIRANYHPMLNASSMPFDTHLPMKVCSILDHQRHQEKGKVGRAPQDNHTKGGPRGMRAD
jgi:hypothetical protein